MRTDDLKKEARALVGRMIDCEEPKDVARLREQLRLILELAEARKPPPKDLGKPDASLLDTSGRTVDAMLRFEEGPHGDHPRGQNTDDVMARMMGMFEQYMQRLEEGVRTATSRARLRPGDAEEPAGTDGARGEVTADAR